MRIGIFSDIHGNAVALDAMLQDLKTHPADTYICLGDALQGGCQPREVAAKLGEMGCPVIMGNADSFVLKGKPESSSVEAVSPPMMEVREWTVEQLGEEGMRFIESFIPTYEVDMGQAGKLLCFHGSPSSFDEVLLPESPVEELKNALDADAPLMCGGHTHLQWIVSLENMVFFNPGSVGVSYNRNLEMEVFYIYPVAEYAIVTTEGSVFNVEFCRVPFDVDDLESAAKASGRPYSENEGAKYRPRP